MVVGKCVGMECSVGLFVNGHSEWRDYGLGEVNDGENETHSSTSSCVNSKNGFPFKTAALLIKIVGVPN